MRFAQPRALGRKVSDEFTVPVCRLHHRELHRHGDEADWWRQAAIDPVPIALSLWQRTRQDASSRALGEEDRATAPANAGDEVSAIRLDGNIGA